MGPLLNGTAATPHFGNLHNVRAPWPLMCSMMIALIGASPHNEIINTRPWPLDVHGDDSIWRPWEGRFATQRFNAVDDLGVSQDGAYREHTWNVQGAHMELTGYIHGTSMEHIHGSFREHLWSVH